jgi:hypothetical protein
VEGVKVRVTLGCRPPYLLAAATLALGLSGCGDDATTGPEPPSDAPARLVIISGDGQSAMVETPLPEPLVVKLTDESGSPLGGVHVSWELVGAAGAIAPLADTTDALGLARAGWTLGSAAGQAEAVAAVEGVPPVTFTASAMDFGLSCDPSDLSVPQGSSVTIVCRVTSSAGFHGQVTLGWTSSDAGATLELSPSSVLLLANSYARTWVAVRVAGDAALGAVAFDVLGTIENVTRRTTVSMTVVQPRPRVRLVYLVPQDRTERADYASAMEWAARHLQIWYRRGSGNGTTFVLSDPSVEIYETPHDAEWYATNPAGDFWLWYWSNVLEDGFALSGGGFNDPENIWIYYVDADPACRQIGGGGTSGVAVLPANDLRGLIGEPTIPPCEGQPPDAAGPCRFVGGLGHELGHALRLPHPPGCESGEPSCPSQALMWLGYRTYPDAFLTEDDKTKLNASAFFSQLRVPLDLFDCSNLSRSSMVIAGRAPGGGESHESTATLSSVSGYMPQRCEVFTSFPNSLR